MKKYVPSGYQIIDLGTIDLSNLPVTITASENEDVKTICEIVKEKRLSKKPILLAYTDQTGLRKVGFCSIGTNNNLTNGIFGLGLSINVVSDHIDVDEE